MLAIPSWRQSEAIGAVDPMGCDRHYSNCEVFMGRELVEIKSDAMPETYLSRIAESIDMESNMLIYPKGSKEFIGKLDGLNFQIHKRINYRNGFQIHVHGRVLPYGGGSAIFCWFGISKYSKIALYIINILMIVYMFISITDSINKFGSLSRWGKEEYLNLVAPLAILSIIWITYFLGRTVSAKEKTRLIELVNGVA